MKLYLVIEVKYNQNKNFFSKFRSPKLNFVEVLKGIYDNFDDADDKLSDLYKKYNIEYSRNMLKAYNDIHLDDQINVRNHKNEKLVDFYIKEFTTNSGIIEAEIKIIL